MSCVSVEQWKDMFSQVGLSESDMMTWHRIFEKTNPEGHQRFLEWLEPDNKQWVETVRAESK